MNYLSFHNRLKTLLSWMEKIVILIGICLFSIVILANALEIFLRTAGFPTLFWIQEFTVVSCSYLTFLGAAVIFKRKGDILVTFIYDLFPKAIQSLLSVGVDLLILFFLIFGVKTAYAYVAFVSGGRTQTIGLPEVFVYLPVLLGFVLILIVVIDWLFDDLEKVVKRSPRERTGDGS
jgi:TRAP-type C4-dicarboxylate transport system permease small subunit